MVMLSDNSVYTNPWFIVIIILVVIIVVVLCLFFFVDKKMKVKRKAILDTQIREQLRLYVKKQYAAQRTRIKFLDLVINNRKVFYGRKIYLAKIQIFMTKGEDKEAQVACYRIEKVSKRANKKLQIDNFLISEISDTAAFENELDAVKSRKRLSVSERRAIKEHNRSVLRLAKSGAKAYDEQERLEADLLTERQYKKFNPKIKRDKTKK